MATTLPLAIEVKIMALPMPGRSVGAINRRDRGVAGGDRNDAEQIIVRIFGR